MLIVQAQVPVRFSDKGWIRTGDPTAMCRTKIITYKLNMIFLKKKCSQKNGRIETNCLKNETQTDYCAFSK